LNITKKTLIVTTITAILLASATLTSSIAFTQGGLVLLSEHKFEWMDPESGGQVTIIERVYEGCWVEDEFIPHDMTWEYTVENIDYNPLPGITNGFSGFQILFPQPVPELYNQQSPAVGGPWEQNAFSGQFPPFGVEWDAPLPGVGIMPGETGVFSFCTYERMDVIVEAPDAGWAHTWGWPVPEPIIDADGTESSEDGVPGFVDVKVLDPILGWPTGHWIEGLDWFDTDLSGTWTFGDDLHVEDPGTHPGAIRDGTHDDNLDPIVLDWDGSLDLPPNNEPVHVDLESGLADPSLAGGIVATGPDPLLAFYDTNLNGFWDDGEDIVLDINDDDVFGWIDNTQSFIHYGPNSVPGELIHMLGVTSSEGEEICKKVKYLDEDRDGVIKVGEEVKFLMVIQVRNPSRMPWTNVKVKDRFAAELEIDGIPVGPTHGDLELTTKGKSEKVFLEWEIGDLGPLEVANLVLHVSTDENPAGKQEYTSPGIYEFNSGAVLKFRDPRGKQHSFETGSIYLEVLP
jgi:hypothetical protein